jgi:alpha-glucosidase
METPPWWQRGVVYQIWLRSFYDENGDGSGDLEGLIQKLDYLKWLGVDVLWISPIYPSPMVESGYDVSDYNGVDALFGDIGTFDRFAEAAHTRGLKIILDFVPNHTSDAHPWFQESRASRDNPKRGFYLWQEPKEGGAPPNNWVSCFGGSAWAYDKQTAQFYYHAFLPQQPDLNLRNPEVQGAIADAMRFWLRRGVDGFRMDAIWHIVKDEELRDNPVNEQYTPDLPPDNVVRSDYTRDRPEAHDVIAMMRRVVDELPERVLGGELYVDVQKMMTYYGSKERPELHLPWNLQLSVIPWGARAVGDWIEAYHGALPEGAWPNWAIGTHDASRIVSRAGAAQARVAAMLLLTLRGTPTVYYGDEIGMHDVEIPRGEIVDPREMLTPYLGLGRDPARTPMQWSEEPNAGFTTGKPWLPIAPDAGEVNVHVETDDPRSMLTLHRRLLALRRETPALISGGYAAVRRDDGVLVYAREVEGGRVTVALNFTKEPRTIEMQGTVLLSTHLDREGDRAEGTLELRPDEGIIVQ